jgi:hypothetical protein
MSDVIQLPWRQRKNSALVERYSAKLQDWAVIAEGKNTPELDASDVAALIVEAVNRNTSNEELIDELAEALGVCLDGALDFSSELDADRALRRARERRKR